MIVDGDMSGRYIDMALHALAHPVADVLDSKMDRPAQSLFECAVAQSVAVGDLGFGALLSDCERRGASASEEEARLAKLLGRSRSKATCAVMAISSAARLAEAGAADSALLHLDSELPKAIGSGLQSIAWRLQRACGSSVLSGAHSPPQISTDLHIALPHEKELRLLEHVVSSTWPADAALVCEEIERFAEDVLASDEQWLKVAGGEKTGVLCAAVESALRRTAPSGMCSVLEVGTYCGYSSIRLASMLMKMSPPGKVVTLEVVPLHAAIARCLAMHAGCAHIIDVWTGHSEDVLPSLHQRYNGSPPGFAAVFMDQRGSRYVMDLEMLLQLSLLRAGAVVVADNVLKPGAPLYLWRTVHGGDFQTEIATLQEFAMPVEDWMSAHFACS